MIRRALRRQKERIINYALLRIAFPAFVGSWGVSVATGWTNSKKHKYVDSETFSEIASGDRRVIKLPLFDKSSEVGDPILIRRVGSMTEHSIRATIVEVNDVGITKAVRFEVCDG